MDGKRYFGVLVVAALFGACLGGAAFGVQKTGVIQNALSGAPSSTPTKTATSPVTPTATAPATTQTGMPAPTGSLPTMPTGTRPAGTNFPGGPGRTADIPPVTG